MFPTLTFPYSYQIPRASGQSLAMPATVSRGDTGLSNRKCSWLASVWTGEQPYSVRSSFKTTTLNSFIWVVVCVITDINEFLLLSISHLSQAVVAPSQVSLQARQGRHHHALHLAPLWPAAGRRKAQPADAATGTDAAWQHVALVEHPRVDLQSAQGVKSLLAVTWRGCFILPTSKIKCV